MNVISRRSLLFGILQSVIIISFLESRPLRKRKITDILGDLNKLITGKNDKIEERTIQEHVKSVRATNPHLHRIMEVFAELERRNSSLQKRMISQVCLAECDGNFYACLNSNTGRVGFDHVYACRNQKLTCLENICNFQHGFPRMM